MGREIYRFDMFIPFLEQFSYLQVRNQKQCQYLEEYSTHQEHQPQRSLDFSDFSSSAFRFLFPTRPPTVWSPALMPAAVRSLCIPTLSISQTETSSSWDFYLLIQLNLEMRLICVCFGAFCNFSVHFLVGAWLIIGYSPWKLRKIKKMKLQFLNLKFEEKNIIDFGEWDVTRRKGIFLFSKKYSCLSSAMFCFIVLVDDNPKKFCPWNIFFCTVTSSVQACCTTYILMEHQNFPRKFKVWQPRIQIVSDLVSSLNARHFSPSLRGINSCATDSR